VDSIAFDGVPRQGGSGGNNAVSFTSICPMIGIFGRADREVDAIGFTFSCPEGTNPPSAQGSIM